MSFDIKNFLIKNKLTYNSRTRTTVPGRVRSLLFETAGDSISNFTVERLLDMLSEYLNDEFYNHEYYELDYDPDYGTSYVEVDPLPHPSKWRNSSEFSEFIDYLDFKKNLIDIQTPEEEELIEQEILSIVETPRFQEEYEKMIEDLRMDWAYDQDPRNNPNDPRYY